MQHDDGRTGLFDDLPDALVDLRDFLGLILVQALNSEYVGECIGHDNWRSLEVVVDVLDQPPDLIGIGKIDHLVHEAGFRA